MESQGSKGYECSFKLKKYENPMHEKRWLLFVSKLNIEIKYGTLTANRTNESKFIHRHHSHPYRLTTQRKIKFPAN